MTKNKFWCFFCAVFLSACSQSDNQYIGKQYLGAKYMNNPLGEEMAPDSDPIVRYDAFDCTTFVETALANGDKDLLTKIRYQDGKIGFLTRNHFIETDWITNNADIVKNVSDRYAAKTAVRTVTIDKQRWFKKTHNLDVSFPKTTVNIEYIPYTEAHDIKTTKPLVVLFIIDNPKFIDKIGSDLAVAHMGFLLPDGTLRHASSQFGRVMDVDFQEYINEHAKNKTNIGIALLEIK